MSNSGSHCSSLSTDSSSQDSSHPPHLYVTPTVELLHPDPLHPDNACVAYYQAPTKNLRVPQPKHCHLPAWEPPWITDPSAPATSTNKMVIVHPKSTFLKDETALNNVYNSSLCNSNAWTCVECLKVFYMKNRLKLHYMLEHNMGYCHLCDVFMEGEEEKVDHQQRIHDGKTCDFCYVLINPTDLSEHHRLEHDVVSCPYCFAYIRPSSELSGHMTHTHKLKVAVNDPNIPRLFKQTGGESFVCFLCAENRKKELTGHFNMYHKVHTHILADLFVKYKVDLTLVVEGASETRLTKNVTCEVCGEKIPELVPNEFHFIYCRHQFFCVICRTIFPTSGDLNAHNALVHERHSCKLNCTSLAYNSSENLTKHYLNYHKMDICRYCDEMVSTIEENSEEIGASLRKHAKIVHAWAGKGGGERDARLVEVIDNDGDLGYDLCQLSCLLCNDILSSTSPNDVYLHFLGDHNIISDKLLTLIGGNLLTKLGEVEEKENEELKNETDGEDANISSKREVVIKDAAFPPIFDQKSVECLFDFNEITTDLETKCELCPEEFSSPLQYIAHLYAFHNLTIPKKFLKCDECGFKRNKTTDLLLKHFKHYIEVENHRDDNKNFNCNICKTEIWLSDALEHYKNHHGKYKDSKNMKKHGYKCRFCRKVFWSPRKRDKHEVKDHFEEEANKCRFYSCSKCSKKFTGDLSFQQHGTECKNKSDDSVILYHCLKCSMVLPSISETTKHFESDHKDLVRFLCMDQLCNGSFKIRRIARRHYYNVHVNKILKENQDKMAKYLCNICGQSLLTKRSLGRHRQIHTAHKRLFKCMICNEKFMTSSIRNAHIQLQHVGISRYKCPECDEMFHSKSALCMHRTTHSALLKCSYCGKEFSRRDSYKEHLLIHEGPRHQCPHCPRAFTQMSNLRRHLRIHTGEKPYKCPFCEKSFSDAGACKSHTSIHTREQECRCDICGKTYSKKQKLRYHMKTHTGEDMHPCHICHKDFVGKYALRVHLTSHEGGGQASIYVCDLCSKEWKTKRSLTRHRKTCKGVKTKTRKNLKHNLEDMSDGKTYFRDKYRNSKHLRGEEEDGYTTEKYSSKNNELRESKKLAKLRIACQNAWGNERQSDTEENINKNLMQIDISEMLVSIMDTGESEDQNVDGTSNEKIVEDESSVLKLPSAIGSKLDSNESRDEDMKTVCSGEDENSELEEYREDSVREQFVDVKVELKEEEPEDDDEEEEMSHNFSNNN